MELTKYEDRIMYLLISGATQQEVAYQLNRNRPAIRVTLGYIKKKLKARTLAQACSMYVKLCPIIPWP
jgi:DNA-binding CsgD family transcriptional regulator